MLVVYASKTGNTRDIAEYISGRSGSALIDLKKESNPDLSEHDVIVICSGVYAGKISKRASSFIELNRDILETKKVALVLSCMYVGEKGQKQLDKLSATVPGLVAKAFYPGKEKENNTKEMDSFVSSLETL